MFKIKFDSDDFMKKINKEVTKSFNKQLKEKFKVDIDISKTKSFKVPFENLISDKNVKLHTNGKFNNIYEFLKAVDVNNQEDYKTCDQKTLDEHTAKNTNFKTFEEFVTSEI